MRKYLLVFTYRQYRLDLVGGGNSKERGDTDQIRFCGEGGGRPVYAHRCVWGERLKVDIERKRNSAKERTTVGKSENRIRLRVHNNNIACVIPTVFTATSRSI